MAVPTPPSNRARFERIVAGVAVVRNVQEAAFALGVTVLERPLSAASMGLTLPPARVILRDNLSGYMKDYVLAHELGHVLVARGRCPWIVPALEEGFCDEFADALMTALRRRTPSRRAPHHGSSPDAALAG